MVLLDKRYCVRYVDGAVECFNDGFWYSDAGIIVKWVILAGFFFIFTGWFLGGYLHAKSRMKKGKPLLAYHRWLVSYSERKRYGQTPQNHFTFYATPQYYGQQPNGQPAYGPRPDGTWPEPPPMYNGDAPPGYMAPPGATKMDPNQNGVGVAVEMPPYGAPSPMGAQQTGVVGGNGNGDVENQQSLPARPQQAKMALGKLMGRFRR